MLRHSRQHIKQSPAYLPRTTRKLMAISNKFRAIRCYKFHVATLPAIGLLFKHLGGIHADNALTLALALFRMMEPIRLQSTLHALLQRQILPAVLTRLPLQVLRTQTTVIAPSLKKLRQFEVAVGLAYLHRHTKHARVDERHTLNVQFHIGGKQSASRNSPHCLVIILKITEDFPVGIVGMGSTGGNAFKKFIPGYGFIGIRHRSLELGIRS